MAYQLLHGLLGVEQVFQQFALVEAQAGLQLFVAALELAVVAVASLQHVIHHGLLHCCFIILLGWPCDRFSITAHEFVVTAGLRLQLEVSGEGRYYVPLQVRY